MPQLKPTEALAAFVLTDPLCRRLAEMGRASGMTMALVGGVVRDFLLGREGWDWDLVVSGDPTPMVRALSRQERSVLIVMDEAFGVVRTRLASGLTLDFARRQGATLEEDLWRRDLSINALACDLEDGRLIDPVGGLADLERGLIRTARSENLADDPLRMLRVFRFAATLDFEVEPATLARVSELAPRIERSAGERVMGELAKLAESAKAAREWAAMERAGLLSALFLELATAPHSRSRGLALVQALISLLRELPQLESPAGARTFELLSRPLSVERSGLVTMQLGALWAEVADPVEALIARLKLSNKEANWLRVLTTQAPALELALSAPDALRADYRYFRRLGTAGLALVVLAMAAERAATAPSESRGWRLGQMMTHYWTFQDGRARTPRLLGGNDLLAELGLTPGPHLGPLMEALDEAQALGEVATREEALALAAELAGGGE